MQHPLAHGQIRGKAMCIAVATDTRDRVVNDAQGGQMAQARVLREELDKQDRDAKS